LVSVYYLKLPVFVNILLFWNGLSIMAGKSEVFDTNTHIINVIPYSQKSLNNITITTVARTCTVHTVIDCTSINDHPNNKRLLYVAAHFEGVGLYLWTAATSGPIVHPQDMIMENHGGIILTGEIRNLSQCPQEILHGLTRTQTNGDVLWEGHARPLPWAEHFEGRNLNWSICYRFVYFISIVVYLLITN
jgi:hypothetical protein